MTNAAVTPTPSEPEAATHPPFDREKLFGRSLKALARLERLYDATRKRLERARRGEDYLAYLIASKRSLIEKLLGLWFTPEDLADVLLEEIGDIPVSRKKVVAAIQQCRMGVVAGDGNSGQKRRDRPPRDAAAESTGTAQPPGQNGEIPKNSEAILAKSRTPEPMSSPKQDSPERQQRFRKKAPTWVAGYGEHPKYGPLLARQDGESDADYCWRMWHTAPPWSDELPRMDSDTQTQWIQKCWLMTSPEERAAHRASLPSTAR